MPVGGQSDFENQSFRTHHKSKMKIKKAILFFNFGFTITIIGATDDKVKKENVLSIFENDLIYKMADVTDYVTKKLADYNDRHLGSSEWGKMMGYDELKPRLDYSLRKGRGLKKMSMALMPLIFHLGATSTWMLITSIMATKAVAIGLLLLVFKIAVSSAKVASFFTLLKSKHLEHHHDAWAWSPPHGHDRSLSHQEMPHDDWSSYSPEWTPSEHSEDQSPAYKTIPMYKENDVNSPYEEIEYEDNKPHKADKRYG